MHIYIHSDMKLDVASIVTGLLHDTVEDTIASLDEIEKEFGTEIRNLVDGVTKVCMNVPRVCVYVCGICRKQIGI